MDDLNKEFPDWTLTEGGVEIKESMQHLLDLIGKYGIGSPQAVHFFDQISTGLEKALKDGFNDN